MSAVQQMFQARSAQIEAVTRKSSTTPQQSSTPVVGITLTKREIETPVEQRGRASVASNRAASNSGSVYTELMKQEPEIKREEIPSPVVAATAAVVEEEEREVRSPRRHSTLEQEWREREPNLPSFLQRGGRPHPAPNTFGINYMKSVE